MYLHTCNTVIYFQNLILRSNTNLINKSYPPIRSSSNGISSPHNKGWRVRLGVQNSWGACVDLPIRERERERLRKMFEVDKVYLFVFTFHVQPTDASKEHNCIPDEHYVQTLLAVR